MDDWQKTMDALVKAFDEFAVKVKRWRTLWLRHSDLAYRYPKTKEKRVSVPRLDMGCLCGNLEENPSLSSILIDRLPGNTYLIREEIIENHLYKA